MEDLLAQRGITVSNILALQPIYLGEMVEKMRVANMADRLVEQFQNGLLSIGTQGSASVAGRNSFFTGRLLASNDLQGEQSYRRKDRP